MLGYSETYGGTATSGSVIIYYDDCYSNNIYIPQWKYEFHGVFFNDKKEYEDYRSACLSKWEIQSLVYKVVKPLKMNKRFTHRVQFKGPSKGQIRKQKRKQNLKKLARKYEHTR